MWQTIRDAIQTVREQDLSGEEQLKRMNTAENYILRYKTKYYSRRRAVPKKEQFINCK